MRKLAPMLLIILFFGCSSTQLQKPSSTETDINYYIDVTNHEDDKFHVTIKTSGLTSENSIYNMPATAPGTYQIMDFGRFVSNVRGFDSEGNELDIEQISVNRWEISDPQNLSVLMYSVDDSFDAELEERLVAPMSGTGIEENFIAMNTFGVLGYFEGLQSYPIELKIEYKPDWKIGTSLTKNTNDYYTADTYDQLADSPILLGDLSLAKTLVNEIPVEVYVYSSDTSITADKVLGLSNDVLQSAAEFIGFDAAPHYKFLMVLMDQELFGKNNFFTAGALEHNLSSLYVMPVSLQALPQLRSTMAHEFLHILTPLNLHSELIHTFNFIDPKPSQHVWLYEGVTEWASDIMQLRSGLMSYRDYLDQVTQKLNINDNFDQDISLLDMSLKSFGEEGYNNFLNFYMKGALTAMCLDLEILKLSNGTKGFREVFIQLLKDYGKSKPFPEDKFFEILVERTYPKVRAFIDNYIIGSELLPVADYMEDLGFKYTAEKISDDTRPTFGINIGFDGENLILTQVSGEPYEWGFRDNDVIMAFNGEEITIMTAQAAVNKAYSELKVGDPYEITVKRGEEVLTLEGEMQQRISKHVFEIDENPTAEQQKLRDAWSTNL